MFSNVTNAISSMISCTKLNSDGKLVGKRVRVGNSRSRAIVTMKQAEIRLEKIFLVNCLFRVASIGTIEDPSINPFENTMFHERKQSF